MKIHYSCYIDDGNTTRFPDGSVQIDVNPFMTSIVRALLAAREVRNDHIAFLWCQGWWYDVYTAAIDLDRPKTDPMPIVISGTQLILGAQTTDAWFGLALRGGKYPALTEAIDESGEGRYFWDLLVAHAIIVPSNEEKQLLDTPLWIQANGTLNNDAWRSVFDPAPFRLTGCLDSDYAEVDGDRDLVEAFDQSMQAKGYTQEAMRHVKES